MRTKKAYQALADDLSKHKELIIEDHDLSCLGLVRDKIFTRELIEDYGWAIPEHITGNENWFSINSEIKAGTFGGGTVREISWEDDGKDPGGEFLLNIGFSTGPYFFGEDYDVEFFKKFFAEIVSYNPKFKDTTNKNLYFSKVEAGAVLSNYKAIVKKYRDLYKSQSNARRAKELREELRKLEAQ